MKRTFFVLLTCLFAQTAWAGWVVTYKDAESGAKSQEFYESGKANIGEMIYTGKHFLAIDRSSKSYWKGTVQQYCDALGAQMKKLEAQMASLPAQYRPKPISQKKVTRKKLGNKTIAGFSSTGYEFYVDGSQEGRIWVSSDSGLSGILDIERSMGKKVKCLEGSSKMSLEGSALYTETTKNKFILKESYREVVSVESKSVPSSVFDAPSGYKSFSDYDQFVDYASNNSGSSSGGYSDSYDDSMSMPSESQDSTRAEESDSYEQSADNNDNTEEEDDFDLKDLKKGMGDAFKSLF